MDKQSDTDIIVKEDTENPLIKEPSIETILEMRANMEKIELLRSIDKNLKVLVNCVEVTGVSKTHFLRLKQIW